jgi:hypothetical protein
MFDLLTPPCPTPWGRTKRKCCSCTPPPCEKVMYQIWKKSVKQFRSRYDNGQCLTSWPRPAPPPGVWVKGNFALAIPPSCEEVIYPIWKKLVKQFRRNYDNQQCLTFWPRPACPTPWGRTKRKCCSCTPPPCEKVMYQLWKKSVKQFRSRFKNGQCLTSWPRPAPPPGVGAKGYFALAPHHHVRR